MTIQTTPTTSLLNDQFVDMKFITHLTGLTDKWFYKLIQEGEFPKPIKLGRSSRWLKSEVEQWLQARIDESRGATPPLDPKALARVAVHFP
ncbi:TPA: AlpA family transcriptional regulator [Proteus mirabilis]|nr:AlpA family transcriptional regulator [Proteus mirabilis]